MPWKATRCRRPQRPTALQRKEPAAMHPTQTLTTLTATPAEPSRRFDGAPETDVDRRFFDLRESGYTGWIDSDGHPVDGPTFVRTDTTEADRPVRRVTPATTLRDAAGYLDRYGWCQGGYYEQTARGVMPAACTVGAIGMVCYGSQVEAPAMYFDHPGWGDFEQAV